MYFRHGSGSQRIKKSCQSKTTVMLFFAASVLRCSTSKTLSQCPRTRLAKSSCRIGHPFKEHVGVNHRNYVERRHSHVVRSPAPKLGLVIVNQFQCTSSTIVQSKINKKKSSFACCTKAGWMPRSTSLTSKTNSRICHRPVPPPQIIVEPVEVNRFL